MATAYSGEVAVGAYNRVRLRVEYSGTSAHCYMEFRRTSTYTGSWGDTDSSITFNGITVTAPYWYSGTVGESWVQLCDAGGFTVSTSGGNYSWNFNNPGGDSVLGCSGSIAIPAQSSAPTGLSVSVAELYPDGAKLNVSITSYGIPNSGYIEAGILSTNSYSTNPRRYTQSSGVLSDSLVVNNDNSVSTGTLNIQPNTQYYYGGYASNTQLSVSSVFGQLVTLAAAPSVALVSTTLTSAMFGYSIAADGGFYNKTLSYSIDGGTTWNTIATITSGSATTGTFTVPSLTQNTLYTLKTKVVTTAGTTNGIDLPFYSLYDPSQQKFYGPVGGEAKRATTMYGSINNQSATITKLYGSVGGEAKLIHQGFGHLSYV